MTLSLFYTVTIASNLVIIAANGPAPMWHAFMLTIEELEESIQNAGINSQNVTMMINYHISYNIKIHHL